ncbi:MAG: hypothetical protein R3E96_07820 [Planctomycetota bacterium]
MTELPRAGWALAPGQDAGVLLVLGRAKQLVLPEGLAGFVCPGGPEPVHAPVTAGQRVLELSPLDASVPGAHAAAQGSDNSAA